MLRTLERSSGTKERGVWMSRIAEERAFESVKWQPISMRKKTTLKM